jgi:hypothetical protein
MRAAPPSASVPELVKAIEQLREEKFPKIRIYLRSPASMRHRQTECPSGLEKRWAESWLRFVVRSYAALVVFRAAPRLLATPQAMAQTRPIHAVTKVEGSGTAAKPP